MGQINRQSKAVTGPCIQTVLSEYSLDACTQYGSINKVCFGPLSLFKLVYHSNMIKRNLRLVIKVVQLTNWLFMISNLVIESHVNIHNK